MSKLLVTGASGGLGRLVLDRLLAKNEAGHRIIATTRDPDALADYAKRGVEVRRADFDGELDTAFAGADRALVISTDAVDRPGKRVEQHRRAIAALEKAGARHVTYTSLPKADTSSIAIAPDHAQTEAALAASKLDFTVLRNNWYLHFITEPVKAALATGKLIDAREGGAVAYVTREDCALAAAHALLLGTPGRNTWDVTGPEALSSDQIADLLEKIFGKKIEHVRASPEEVRAGLVGHGMPAPFADLLVSFDVGVSKGDLAQVTDTVKRLSGETPKSVAQWLTENRGVFAEQLGAHAL